MNYSGDYSFSIKYVGNYQYKQIFFSNGKVYDDFSWKWVPKVNVIFGFNKDEPIDRSSVNYNDEENRGDVVFDQSAADALAAPTGSRTHKGGVWPAHLNAGLTGHSNLNGPSKP